MCTRPFHRKYKSRALRQGAGATRCASVVVCAQGVEATLYSALMSISNAAGGLGSLLGAGLTWALGITATQFEALPALVGICALSGLLPLPLLRFVPQSSSASQPAEIQL